MKRTPAGKRNYTIEKRTYGKAGLHGGAAATGDFDWYTRDTKDLWEGVFGRIREIKQKQIPRRYELYAYQQAYTNRYGPTALGSLYQLTTRNPSMGMQSIVINLIKRIIDAAVARIAKEKPRAFALPRKDDYRIKRKCKNMTKFLDGAMVSANVYANSEDVFRDACLFGDGTLIPYAHNGRICSAVAKVDELWIDALDGMYDDPTEVHWSHPWPRRTLLSEFPDQEKMINEARAAWKGELSYMGQADLVECVWSWKRPSQPGKADGRWCKTVCTGTLGDGVWKRDYLPAARFHWTPPTYGPFGDGIAKEILGHQRALQDIVRGVLKSIRMFAVPRVWVSKMANVASSIISNEITVNEYSGEKPVFDTPPAAAPDIYQFVQWIIDDAFKQARMSQLTAQSEKPAGLNAAVALRTYHDIETQGFAVIGQRWERWYLMVARMLVDLAEDIYADKKKLSVKVPGRGFIEEVDWGDLSLEKDQWDMEVWPTSILPLSVEAQIQTATEFMQSGLMPRNALLQQLRIPMIYEWIDRETAAEDNVDMALTSILADGKYIPPDPVGNSALALREAQLAKLRAMADKQLDPSKLELLERFILRATELQNAANATPPGAGQPGAPGPEGTAPPPTGAPPGRAPGPPQAPLAPQTGQPVAPPQAA